MQLRRESLDHSSTMTHFMSRSRSVPNLSPSKQAFTTIEANEMIKRNENHKYTIFEIFNDDFKAPQPKIQLLLKQNTIINSKYKKFKSKLKPKLSVNQRIQKVKNKRFLIEKAASEFLIEDTKKKEGFKFDNCFETLNRIGSLK